MKEITDYLTHAIDYPSYRELIDQLLAAGKTSGDMQTEKRIHFTRLNVQRMKRLDKTTKLIPDLQEKLSHLNRSQIWLVITEAWCGDAAQIVPLFRHIEKVSDHISLKLLFRDENPALMDQFLTNGARAIPKMISLDADTHAVLGTWGPRPQTAQQMVMDHKVNPILPEEAFKKELHTWFARDKTLSIQKELLDCLKEWDQSSKVA